MSANSRRQLLNKVATRINLLATRQERNKNNAWTKKPKFKAPRLFGHTEHIVMMANGKTPKLLFATEDLASDSKLQTLIGYIYATLDPSSQTRDHRNRPLHWWKGGRKNFLKYQAFKYTSKVAP